MTTSLRIPKIPMPTFYVLAATQMILMIIGFVLFFMALYEQVDTASGNEGESWEPDWAKLLINSIALIVIIVVASVLSLVSSIMQYYYTFKISEYAHVATSSQFNWRTTFFLYLGIGVAGPLVMAAIAIPLSIFGGPISMVVIQLLAIPFSLAALVFQLILYYKNTEAIKQLFAEDDYVPGVSPDTTFVLACVAVAVSILGPIASIIFGHTWNNWKATVQPDDYA